jgi:hypothetical protein
MPVPKKSSKKTSRGIYIKKGIPAGIIAGQRFCLLYSTSLILFSGGKKVFYLISINKKHK